MERECFEGDEIAITGDLRSQGTKDKLKALRTEFIPNKVVLFKAIDDSELVKLASFVKGMKIIDNKTTLYICRDFTWSTPTTDTGRLRTMLKEY